MLKDLFKNYIYPMAVFSSGMIGVGFLSLPYLARETGVWLILFYFLAIIAITVVINLIFCDVTLKTPDFKRFPGFVGYYLGKWGKIFSMAVTVPGTLGVLLVYLIVGGQFLQTAFSPLFSANILIYVFIYFLLTSTIIYFDIKVASRVEFWVIATLFLFIVVIFIEGFSKIKVSNIAFPVSLDFKKIFLPYGPMLFAFWNISLIPEVEEMVVKRKNNLKKIIIFSTLLVSVFYIFFTFVVLGITGQQTSQTALQGLKGFFPDIILSFSVLVGALATFVAYITQGIIFKKTMVLDFKIKHWQAFIITCCPPMIFFLMGLNSFVSIISIIGGVLLGINGLLVLMMYRKISLKYNLPRKNILIYSLSVIFLLGGIYEIIYFI